jgi:hypothetical protein
LSWCRYRPEKREGRIQEEESRRFLKKAPQKLFVAWAMGVVAAKAHAPN